MILKGSQRGGARKLASHLLNMVENDHVEVHELRGFSSDDLRGALRETDAIAKGTKCKQFLFSLSLNPPDTEQVSVAQFEAAIAKVEEKLKLTGQARAIVFHEKEGRRHAHAVWSRIDVVEMKAINLPWYRYKLKDISKELFLEHGWRLPGGLRDRENRNPLNFTQAEWQQAKRSKQDPQRLKVMFRECWATSDSGAAFAHALLEKGYHLARGDRRGFVAVDCQGEVWSLSRWAGQKKKALREKIGDPAALPGVDQTRTLIAKQMTAKLRGFIAEANRRAEETAASIHHKKQDIRIRQRTARSDLSRAQSERQAHEAKTRANRFRKGVRGLWDFVSGRTGKIKKQNELEAKEAAKRDAQERDKQISAQLAERRLLQRDLRRMKQHNAKEIEQLHQDVAHYIGLGQGDGPLPAKIRRSNARRPKPDHNPDLSR